MYDLIIIGAGPAGVSCAIYGKRAGLNILIFENNLVGGQVNSAGLVENYPAFEKIDGISLANSFKNHLKSLDIKTNNENILSINKINNYFVIKTENNLYKSKTLLIATGSKPRKLNIDKEKELLGQGVGYCSYCDGPLYKNLDVCILGSGNSATEASIYLSNIASKVYLILNKDTINADNITINTLEKTKNIEIIKNTEITKLISDNNKLLSQIEIKNLITNKHKILNISGLFIYIGSIPQTKLLKENFSMVLDENNYIITNDNLETQISGLYAAGDVRKSDIKQIVTAVSEGAKASINIYKHIKKDNDI